jgi:hypothetical protein
MLPRTGSLGIVHARPQNCLGPFQAIRQAFTPATAFPKEDDLGSIRTNARLKIQSACVGV